MREKWGQDVRPPRRARRGGGHDSSSERANMVFARTLGTAIAKSQQAERSHSCASNLQCCPSAVSMTPPQLDAFSRSFVDKTEVCCFLVRPARGRRTHCCSCTGQLLITIYHPASKTLMALPTFLWSLPFRRDRRVNERAGEPPIILLKAPQGV